jgi:hypothetical protein
VKAITIYNISDMVKIHKRKFALAGTVQDLSYDVYVEIVVV